MPEYEVTFEVFRYVDADDEQEAIDMVRDDLKNDTYDDDYYTVEMIEEEE